MSLFNSPPGCLLTVLHVPSQIQSNNVYAEFSQIPPAEQMFGSVDMITQLEKCQRNVYSQVIRLSDCEPLNVPWGQW